MNLVFKKKNPTVLDYMTYLAYTWLVWRLLSLERESVCVLGGEQGSDVILELIKGLGIGPLEALQIQRVQK